MILVTGAKGLMGSSIIEYLQENKISFVGVDKEEFDITDREQTIHFIRQLRSDCILHCGAYSNVEMAEDELESCMKTNVEGTENIILACKEIDAKLLYFSSDYVFDGEKENPYLPEDEVNPLSVYGRSKAMGEERIRKLMTKYFIIRTSWLFGKTPPNFLDTMLWLGKTKNSLTVVNDQVGSPTYTKDLTPLLIQLINTEKYGTYHITNEGYCSWAEFAKEIMKAANLSCEIIPILSEDYPSKAKRPKNSRLDKDKLVQNGFKLLPTWQDALNRYLKNKK